MFPTTLASVARMIVETLDQRGLDGRELMSAVGMNPELLCDPNARYPFSCMSRFWMRATEESGDDCLGLDVARMFHATALHGLGFAWLASDSLTDAMQRLARYYRVATTAAVARLDTEGDTYHLHIERAGSAPPAAPAAVDAAAAMLVGMCRKSAGPGFRPLHVALPRPQPTPACAERLIQLIRAPVAFDAPHIVFDVDAAVADRRLPTGNAELAHANEKVLIDYLAHLERNAVSARVKARLVDTLPSGDVNEAMMADSLNMSTRSLQRRLRDEDTSYKRLLDDTRRELALQYLGNSRLSVNEVTYLLGFSDPSNFSRAFRRWQGTSPSDYRARQQGQTPAA